MLFRSAEVARTTFVPSKALVVAAEGSELRALIPWLEGKPAASGQPTAYVCEHGTCELPTGEPEILRQQLTRARPY